MVATWVGPINCCGESFRNLLEFDEHFEHEHWLDHTVIQHRTLELVFNQVDRLKENDPSMIDGPRRVDLGDVDAKLVNYIGYRSGDVGGDNQDVGENNSHQGETHIEQPGVSFQDETPNFDSPPPAPDHNNTTFAAQDIAILNPNTHFAVGDQTMPPQSWAAQQREFAAMGHQSRPQPAQPVSQQLSGDIGSAVAPAGYFISFADHEVKQVELMNLVAAGHVTTLKNVNDWFQHHYGARPDPLAFTAFMNGINDAIGYLWHLSQQTERTRMTGLVNNGHQSGATFGTEFVYNNNQGGATFGTETVNNNNQGGATFATEFVYNNNQGGAAFETGFVSNGNQSEDTFETGFVNVGNQSGGAFGMRASGSGLESEGSHGMPTVDYSQQKGGPSSIHSQGTGFGSTNMAGYKNDHQHAGLTQAPSALSQGTSGVLPMGTVHNGPQNGVSQVMGAFSTSPPLLQGLVYLGTGVPSANGAAVLSLGYPYTATGKKLKPAQLGKTPQKYWVALMDLICRELPRADKIFTGALLQRGNLIRPPPTAAEDAEEDDNPPPFPGKSTKFHAAYMPAPNSANFIIVKWQECIKCQQVFNMDKNHEHRCIYHPGHRTPNLTRADVWMRFNGSPPAFFQSLEDNPFFISHFDWTCCGRQGDEEGCKIGRHAPSYVDVDGVKKRAPFPPR